MTRYQIWGQGGWGLPFTEMRMKNIFFRKNGKLIFSIFRKLVLRNGGMASGQCNGYLWSLKFWLEIWIWYPLALVTVK